MSGSLKREPVPEMPSGTTPADAESPRLAPISSPAPARPYDFEHAEHVVGSFTVGYVNCPEDYRDWYADAWIDSHPDEKPLIYAALCVIDVVEGLQKSRRERLLAGRN